MSERDPDLQDWIDRQLATAPPLTEDQRDAHAAILARTRRRLAAESTRLPLGETA